MNLNSPSKGFALAVALLALTGLVLVGCGSASDAGTASGNAVAADRTDSPKVDSSPKATTAAVQIPVAPRRDVVRNASLDVRVQSVEKSEKEVGRIVQGVGGYVETASSQDLAAQSPVLKMTVRVPVSQFDACIAQFEGLGVRLSKSISAEDVTTKLVDMDARLESLKAQEQTYRRMLLDRRNLEEVYSIQGKLVEVRTAIESIAGERKAQAGLATLSTISITLEQKTAVMQASTDSTWLSETLGQATSAASGVVRSIVASLTWILVFAPFWAPALLLLRWMIRLQTRGVSKPPRVAP